MTIHDFDMSRYLLDQEITEVFAVGNALVSPAVKAAGDIDTAVITLTYESGAYCVIDNSRQAVYGYDQRIEVFGSEGCVIIGNRRPYESTLYTRETVSNPLPLHFFLQRYTESFLEEMRQFITSIQEDTRPLVTGHDGRIPVEIGLAAQRSLESHRPVKLRRPEEK
jgi:myo-inositol 2-dehydrogenase/D-chiro-inositol 1-dehydrogenase